MPDETAAPLRPVENAQFDRIGPSRLDGFAKYLSTSKDKLEEKFRNVEIRQDGPLERNKSCYILSVRG